MERDRSAKIIAIVALCVAVVGLSIGFAAFSNNLTIKSNATVSPNQNDYLLCNKVLMESFENLIIVFTNINRHILSTNISCF